jgi:hypothetical protein
MPWRRVPILDSRGVARLVPPPNSTFGAVRAEPREEQLNAIRAGLHGVSSGAMVRVVGGVVLGIVIGVAVYRVARNHLGPVEGPSSGILFGVLLGGGAGWALARLGLRPPDFSAAMGLHDLRACVCCGYDLREVPAAADGCTVCPECGGAWRLVPARADEARA